MDSVGSSISDIGMDERHARQLAEHLMRQHGLLDAGWRFAWGHGHRRLGSVQVRAGCTGPPTRTLRLSRHLVDLNDEPVVRDVILHEIAHALVGVENGHGPAWRAACRRIGARPQRLADASVRVPTPPLALVCGQCQTIVAKRYRRPVRRWLARAYCRHCGPASLGALQCKAHTQ